MLKYEKPVVESTEDVAESVYMASGDVKTGVCPYGRDLLMPELIYVRFAQRQMEHRLQEVLSEQIIRDVLTGC